MQTTIHDSVEEALRRHDILRRMKEIDDDNNHHRRHLDNVVNLHQEFQGLILTDDRMGDTPPMRTIVEDTGTMTIEGVIVEDMGLTMGMIEKSMMIHDGIVVDHHHQTITLMNGVRADL